MPRFVVQCSRDGRPDFLPAEVGDPVAAVNEAKRQGGQAPFTVYEDKAETAWLFQSFWGRGCGDISESACSTPKRKSTSGR